MTLDIAHLVILFFVGCLAGFINVMAGGGSMLAMPVLIFMGIPGPMANGTNRIAVLVQNCAATASYARQKVAEPRLSFTLGLCALPGAVVGAYFGTKLEGAMFNYVLAGIMLMVLAYMIFSHYRKTRLEKVKTSVDQASDQTLARPIDIHDHPQPTRAQNLAGHLLMFGIGLYGGFIQAGVGIVIMASLSGVMGMTLVRANIHKVFIIGLYTLVALAIFSLSNDIYWTAGLCLACGNALGALVAARLNLRSGDRLIRILLYAVILAMAANLIRLSL